MVFVGKYVKPKVQWLGVSHFGTVHVPQMGNIGKNDCHHLTVAGSGGLGCLAPNL